LISAIGQVEDVSRCVTMDFKRAGNFIYLVGETHDELGGSHFALVNDLQGGQVPTVNPEAARQSFAAMHRAINSGLVRACHDPSEGGLAVAAAEMAFAGGLGARIDVAAMPTSVGALADVARLFSESNTRFLCEIESEKSAAFEDALKGIAIVKIGEVTGDTRLEIGRGGTSLIDVDIFELKEAWQAPLRW
jgi:phosphoribosylformylglycinamidine synthase